MSRKKVNKQETENEVKRELVNMKNIVDYIAEQTGFTKKDVREVLTSLQDLVYAVLPEKDIKLIEGITLSAQYKRETTAKNPRTGVVTPITARMIPRCKFGIQIKRVLKEATEEPLSAETEAAE